MDPRVAKYHGVLREKAAQARVLEILGGITVSPEAVTRGLRDMGIYYCYECQQQKDNDVCLMSEHPSEPGEAICENCLTELESQLQTTSLKAREKL